MRLPPSDGSFYGASLTSLLQIGPDRELEHGFMLNPEMVASLGPI